MEYINSKKGFTLVELLAVIVILALIMGIAAYSMQGVTENVKISSIKSSALTWVDGVRNMLLSNMNLKEGDYYFNDKILKTSVDSPWGGSYVYYTGTDTTIATSLNSYGYAYAGDGVTLVCGGTGATGSFIRVSETNGDYTYSVCLYDSDANYVFAREQVLLKDEAKTDYYRGSVSSPLTLDANGKIAA